MGPWISLLPMVQHIFSGYFIGYAGKTDGILEFLPFGLESQMQF